MTAIDPAELAAAIRRKGSDMEVETFLAVLRDVARSADALTTAEAGYLTTTPDRSD